LLQDLLGRPFINTFPVLNAVGYGNKTKPMSLFKIQLFDMGLSLFQEYHENYY
jgi:hypothetical protein